jgi:hypothetical protein
MECYDENYRGCLGKATIYKVTENEWCKCMKANLEALIPTPRVLTTWCSPSNPASIHRPSQIWHLLVANYLIQQHL